MAEENLDRIRFLADQVAQTAERIRHLGERVPLDAETPSLNYQEDLQRLKGEYNDAVARVLAVGAVAEGDLGAAGLPLQMPT